MVSIAMLAVLYDHTDSELVMPGTWRGNTAQNFPLTLNLTRVRCWSCSKMKEGA